jgi:hypothetical protein
MDQTLVGVLNGVGVVGVVLFGGWLVASGRLVTRREIDRMVDDHVREIADVSHDRDEWRAAHRISETARQVAADQVDELLEHARTTDRFIRSLPYPDQERL